MGARLVLLAVPRRLPPGLLTRDAWDALAAGPVLAGDPGHPQLGQLATQGVEVRVVDPEAAATELASAAGADGTASWLLAGPDDPVLVALGGREGVQVLDGGGDPTGAGLLAAVATMDRLRSPGGCPWDAAQTHASLTRYLLEEAYEAVAAVEDGGLDRDLPEELGDVLLQVLFHARLGAERRPGGGFDIDTVADLLVAKLVGRHPHVFAREGAETLVDPAAVERRWEELKAAEKGRRSVLDGVPVAQPALAYAAAVLRRAGRAGLPLGPASPPEPARADGELLAAGRRLLAEVARCHGAGLDPEEALRAANRELAARVRAAEHAAASPAAPSPARPATP